MSRRSLAAGVAALCALALTAGTGSAHPSGDWPTWTKDLSGSRFNGNEHRITPATVGKLKLKWAFSYPAVPGATPHSQPAVVDGTLYFGGEDGNFYAVDAKSGATKWTFSLPPNDIVRDGPSVAAGRVYFGDVTSTVRALDQRTGRLLWQYRTDATPASVVTSSPIYFEGHIFVGTSNGENSTNDVSVPCCRFRGHVDSIDAATGKLAWRYYTVPPPQQIGTWPSGAARYEPSGVGVWGSPVVDPRTHTLYVGTGENYSGHGGDFDTLLALDTSNGRVRWKQQVQPYDTWRQLCNDPRYADDYCPVPKGGALDWDLASSPNLFTVDGRELVGVGQKSGVYHVFDAHTGQAVWRRSLSTPMPGGGLSGIQWGTSFDGKRLYVATMMADPGTLYALDPATGAELWHTPNPADGCTTGGAAHYPDMCTPSFIPAVTTSPGLVYEGSADGKMRVFDSNTGKVLWTYDTIRDFDGVNGLPGHGGAISGGGGAVVADGMVYVQTGYWMAPYPSDRGHALLAFGL
ncbi:PQQ-binding-like beta-propeller repeat protein [Kutzneria kofuensis]|uniref:Polyvinyl alcohol dehydrogenase (Cytochrome) n=1 Tax=Kutzneria kofuensis TaxID=103725 RepID=A0A7W9KDX0_9PSEU|nr:PQQ-binding-like beta-propeller repeat protein [Kutzneria kofuensis]MBB5890818.1 polyvinyl alcohol dehydrogenase (cytochrome) [Kutzneria kofuensis]